MLTADNVQYKETTQETPTSRVHKTRAVRPATTLYTPKQRDPLFWCFYIVLEGMARYEQVKSHCFATEKEFKIAAVERLRERADELKAHKLRRNDVEDALVNRPKLNLAAFQALCLLYDVSFVYTKGAVYHEFTYGKGEASVVVVEKGRPALYVGSDSPTYADSVRMGRWHVEDSAKPIRAVSAYTLGELREFCDRLNIEHDGKKKAQLYQLIREKIM